MASSSSVVNVDSKRKNTQENPSKTEDILKHPKLEDTFYFKFIFVLLMAMLIASVVISLSFYQAPWKIATNSPSNTCLYPAWNNTNYTYTVLMSSFTLGPVFFCIFLYLLPFFYVLLDQWLKIIITAVFTLAILAVFSVVTAACFAILTVVKTGSPVLLPDGKLLECDQPIANYYNKMRLQYLFPPFALLAAMVILLIYIFIIWDALNNGTVGKESSTTQAANRPLDLPA